MTQKDPTALFGMVRKSRVFNNIIERNQLDKKTVLDVGCSEGHHLACFGEGSLGLTIIDEHIEIARQHGLEVINKNIDNQEMDLNLDRKFDAVWANNLFEHLECPHPFLMKMRTAVKPGGILIIGVPIIPYLPFIDKLKKFKGAYAKSHINFFYRKTIVETVRAAGWNVKEARLNFFKNPILDYCMNLIAPHMYVVATLDEDFEYGYKRKLSLVGYDNHEVEV